MIKSKCTVALGSNYYEAGIIGNFGTSIPIGGLFIPEKDDCINNKMDVTIYLMISNEYYSYEYITTTNALGNFEFNILLYTVGLWEVKAYVNNDSYQITFSDISFISVNYILPSSSIEIIVYDSKQNRIKNALVKIINEYGHQIHAFTDEDGRHHEVINPGNYDIEISKKGFFSINRSFIIPEEFEIDTLKQIFILNPKIELGDLILFLKFFSNFYLYDDEIERLKACSQNIDLENKLNFENLLALFQAISMNK